MSGTLPFDESAVLYRVQPVVGHAACDEFVVTGPLLTLWGRCGDTWKGVSEDYWEQVMACVLADLAKLTEERDIYRQGLEQFRDRTNWRLIDSYTSWIGTNGYDEAAKILEAGEKLRTEGP